MEYSVPAKLGARSCEFCKLVSVAAPLNPKESVKSATIASLLVVYGMANSKSPGMIWAKIMNQNN